MSKYKIAIIGGGTAGLAAAFWLQGAKHMKTRQIVHCDIYEKGERIGGNVDTAYTEKWGKAPFADLGVNDFNHETYTLFVLMLEFLAGSGYEVPYAELTDTTWFFTPKDQEPEVRYTYDDMRTSNQPFLQAISDDWTKFYKALPEAMKDLKYRYMTVDEYCAERGYSEDFIKYNLKPRINGMYYTNGKDPGSMSIYGVLKYYALQENISNPKAGNTRKYFVNGATSWILALEAYLKANDATFHVNVAPIVTRQSHRGKSMWNVNGKNFDAVISAVPAHAVNATFPENLTKQMREIADRVEYVPSTSYYHDDPSVLPDEKDRPWCTYNITIEEPTKTTDRPYVITYVCDMHQGGKEKTGPFVSLDPSPPPPANLIKTMIDPADHSKRIPATVNLFHNTLYPWNIADQETLRALQGRDNLWFTGGWTAGAGLQEEVAGQSLYVALSALGVFADKFHEVHDRDDPDYLPRHLRALFSGEKPDLSAFAGVLPLLG